MHWIQTNLAADRPDQYLLLQGENSGYIAEDYPLLSDNRYNNIDSLLLGNYEINHPC